MKNYRKEKEMKFVGGVALSLVLCVLSTTTTFAAAEGFKAGYEKVFDDTKVEVEEEISEDIEYEEDFDTSKIKIVYDENSDEILRASGDFAEQKLGKNEAANLKSISIT